ncbi:tagaturonate reductase [Paenibacillus provencensis]|uniref:Tagaturonate reductase n=1 Tax=Paenibacillus provencensis TaxID=441151 RepID=A0ABW3PQV6_9BACL|nr:tagaturonate reductase [Paenibacillus sp. MER 78]MCM3130315.1 tagaturonate reductase [Paenibacillus sp. MER 78]
MAVSNDLPRLGRKLEGVTDSAKLARFQDMPVKVLQIGEGNFLRGFFDWMIYESAARGLFEGSIAVTQPRRSGRHKLLNIREQDGLYTLLTRGIENGAAVEREVIIPVLSHMIDPYEEWTEFLALAEVPELDIVVSNTTEAGLAYEKTEYHEGTPVDSFPGKLTVFLHHRFLHFQGDPAKGFIHLPCELVEGNGDLLRSYVLMHSEDFGYSDEFRHWVINSNHFLNNLVDRIVTGTPSKSEIADIEERLGYKDSLINCAEPYHLWAIQGDSVLADKLPLAQAGLNVHFTDDLRPFQLRKVRILNGAHTLMTPLGILQGKRFVRETMEDSQLGEWVRTAVYEEITQALDLPQDQLHVYAGEVFDRFMNPYIDHRLQDIMLGSLSKFKVRLLPTMLEYYRKNDVLPKSIVTGFAALLRLYRAVKTEEGFKTVTYSGESILLKDNEAHLELLEKHWSELGQGQSLDCVIAQILAEEVIWGQDLSLLPGLTEIICESIREWEGEKV